MSDYGAKLEGYDEAIRILNKLPDKLQKNVLLKILRKSGKILIDKARARLLTYGNQYSELAKAIGNITRRNRDKPQYVNILVGPRVKGKWKYVGYIAHWVEYGVHGIKKNRSTRGRDNAGHDDIWGVIVGGTQFGERYRKDQPAKPFMRNSIKTMMPVMKKHTEFQLKTHLDKEVQKMIKRK